MLCLFLEITILYLYLNSVPNSARVQGLEPELVVGAQQEDQDLCATVQTPSTGY